MLIWQVDADKFENYMLLLACAMGLVVTLVERMSVEQDNLYLIARFLIQSCVLEASWVVAYQV